MRTGPDHNQERGAALVETALTMLMFFVVLLAIFEGGRMLNIQQTLTNAAREGARYSVLPAAATGGVYTDTLPTVDAVRTRVRSFLNASGLNGATIPDENIQVDQNYDSPDDSDATRYTRVTVTVPYRVLTISMFSLLQVNLRGQAMMRNETNLQ
jgi:Flp pilus assembly protein TadG